MRELVAWSWPKRASVSIPLFVRGIIFECRSYMIGLKVSRILLYDYYY